MIEMRRTQLGFGDGLIAAEVSDLREGWMKHADMVLSDEAIVAAVYEALANRHPKSRCRGRRGMRAAHISRSRRQTLCSRLAAGGGLASGASDAANGSGSAC